MPDASGTITTTTTTTTTTTIGGNVASTSTMTTTTTHDTDNAKWPMSIRSIIHSIDSEAPSIASWFSSYPEEAIEREQQEQAVATATVAAATAQATATNATATTARVISLTENSRTVIVSTATTNNDDSCLENHHQKQDSVLGKRHYHEEEEEVQDVSYEQLLKEEREKTRRVRARAELVKRMVQLGRSKDEISAELKKACV